MKVDRQEFDRAKSDRPEPFRYLWSSEIAQNPRVVN
jgi:hypothetical protein